MTSSSVAAIPALMDVQAVSEMLCVSPRTVYRLSDSGRMPRPRKLGALVRWSRTELDQWLSAGCPRTDRRAGR